MLSVCLSVSNPVWGMTPASPYAQKRQTSLGLTATGFSLPFGELESNSAPSIVVALNSTMHVSSG